MLFQGACKLGRLPNLPKRSEPHLALALWRESFGRRVRVRVCWERIAFSGVPDTVVRTGFREMVSLRARRLPASIIENGYRLVRALGVGKCALKQKTPAPSGKTPGSFRQQISHLLLVDSPSVPPIFDVG